MSVVEIKSFAIDVDVKRLKRFQIRNILLGFLLAAALMGPVFVFPDNPVLFVLVPFGILVLSLWLWSIPSVFVLRNPLKRIEIFAGEGKVRINDDCYDLKEKTVFFEVDNGLFKCLPFSCTKLKVMNDERETIKTYYTGSGTNKYAVDLRKTIADSLMGFDQFYKNRLSVEKVSDEYADGFGVAHARLRTERQLSGRTWLLGVRYRLQRDGIGHHGPCLRDGFRPVGTKRFQRDWSLFRLCDGALRHRFQLCRWRRGWSQPSWQRVVVREAFQPAGIGGRV